MRALYVLSGVCLSGSVRAGCAGLYAAMWVSACLFLAAYFAGERLEGKRVRKLLRQAVRELRELDASIAQEKGAAE